ncbi:MAG: ABC transporter ATP-binding protein [Candidatus Bathyarchaeia archaeon]
MELTNEDAAIITKGLTKRFGDLVAVNNVNFEIERGEIFGYLGPNGAGKSTTIRMLVGLTTPTEGTATVDGFDIREDMVEIKKRIGVVPEVSNLYNELTVWDNLLYMARLYHVRRDDREDRVKALIDELELQEVMNRGFGKLSKGYKRRTVLAAALVHDPSIVFLDEPTSGLDVVSARALRDMIGDFRERGVTVFLTTHYIEEADRLCDRIALIVKGELIVLDSPERLKSKVQRTPILEALLKPKECIDLSDSDRLSAIDIRFEEDRHKIFTENIPETIRLLNDLASESGFRIEEINTIKPSLEEAFVQLTGLSPEVMKMEKEGKR